MIEKREKRKKIFYVPGMISLVLIPLFCLYHFYKVDAFKVEGMMSFYIPTDSVMIGNFLALKRNYRIVCFNNSLDLERRRINELELALRKLKRENDTVNGIKIHFGKKVKYEMYVRVLEIFQVEDMPYYLQYKDDFLVLMLPKPKLKNKPELSIFVCGYQPSYRSEEDLLKEERKRQIEYLITLFKKNWILFTGYLGLAGVNILALVKFNKTQKYNQK
ncbi:hypothetical protein AAYQ05_19500 [Flavobacterium sp. B11]|uniref:hypothetical protein n=1 Tax=Flavobacterium movens TaxID=214860 RepID=UPI0031DBB9CD